MLPTRICIPAFAWMFILIAAGCSHHHDDSPQTQIQPEPPPQTQPDIQPESQTHTVTTHADADAGGSITPVSISVIHAASTTLTLTPDTGYSIASVTPTGCTGVLVGSDYTTGPITADCTVAASFIANTDFYTVTTVAAANGSITPTSISVPLGASAILTVTPDSDFSIASVTASGCSGTLTGTMFTTGPITSNCTVTANFSAGVTENTFTVTASAGAGGSITPSSVSVLEGASTILTVTPNSDFTIANVSAFGCSGTLTGTVYTTGPITSNCTVTANFSATVTENTFTVTASAGAGGGITPTSLSVIEGAGTTLTVTPNSGFSIASVTPTGCTGTLTGNTYITAPITAHCAVAVVFAANTFTVTASAGTGGNITPTLSSVTHGASTSLSITPETGFSISSVIATGCSGTLTGMMFTTGPITSNCSVTVNFSANVTKNTFTVTASAGAGGSITPSSVSVVEGASTALTVTPNRGFSIASVTPTGCTGTLTGNTYTSGPITTHCAVAASFVADIYNVTASAGAGGSITPTQVSVSHGETAILTITPETGFSISSITASGCSGALAEYLYTTGPITTDCTVTASFALVFTTTLATHIATGGSHTCVFTNTSAMQCWGDNFYGELGNGNTTNSLTPVTVTGLSSPAAALAAGAQHTCALTRASAVQCWGYNRYGQLGNGNTTDSAAPITVNGLSGTITALVAGSYHTCALSSEGAIQCWGYNANGQLGNGSTVNSTTPVTVTGLSGSVSQLVAGAQHNCVLTRLGVTQCWGYNLHGQLGNGSTANSTTPVKVTGLSGSAMTLAAGSNHTCALTSTGAIQCWGYNANGQLGNGSTTNSTTAVTATGLSEPTKALAAGAQHTCALTSAGAVLCWGYNLYGQLGNGSTISSSTPVSVTGQSGSATALAAGYGHNCVLTSTGAVQCWGYNLYGQLGNGSTTNSATAVAVTGLSP